MTKTALFVLAVTVGIVWFFAQTLFALAQSAAPVCGDAKKFIQTLADKHHESGFIEFMANGTKLQLYADPVTGSWTLITYVPPGDRVCIVMTGNTFEPMPMANTQKPKGPEL